MTTRNALLTSIDTKTPPLVAGAVPVTGSVVVPLPAGAATAANQGTEIAGLAAIVTALGSLLTELQQKLEPADISGLATQLTLAAIKTKTDNLDAGLSTRATEATLALVKAKTDNLDVSLAAVKAVLDNIKTKTDNLDVLLSTRTKPADTQPVSAVALPLPAGAATAGNQVTEIASLASVDGKLPALVGGRIPVALPAGGSGLTDLELRLTPVPVTDALGSTAALQTAGNLSLTSLDGKSPALVGGRVPVVLPAGGSGLTDAELRALAVAVSVAALPLPAGAATEAGNLATLAAKDFATQVTLAALLTALNALTTIARVSDSRESYTDGDLRALSMTTDGRLRVGSSPLATDLEFFRAPAFLFDTPHLTADTNPWALGVGAPWQ